MALLSASPEERSLEYLRGVEGFRHLFTTRKLLEGVDTLRVAILLGHSNLSMLADQYSHLTKNPEHLKKALNASAST